MKPPPPPVAYRMMTRSATGVAVIVFASVLLRHEATFASGLETPESSARSLGAPVSSAASESPVPYGSSGAADSRSLAMREQRSPSPADSPPHRVRVPRGQLALTVGLPVFGAKFVHGELTVDFRYGYKFWWLVPYLSGGFRQVRLDQLDWPWEARMRKLLAWHVTLGTRLEFPASQKLFPFIGMAVERAYWAYTEDSSPYCHESYYPSEWRCYKARDWKQGHSFKPQFGLLYKPEPSLALEFWLEYVHVIAPGMFTRNFTFIHPALGLAWHH